MGSYRQIYMHIVFGTKNRVPSISKRDADELYKYIAGIIAHHNCKVYRINGMPDHLHILTDLHPSTTLEKLVKNIKVGSNLWMKESGFFPGFTGWQKGYGAFSVSHAVRDSVIDYIIHQQEHHMKESFEEEYRRLLSEHGIAFTDEYLFEA